MTKQNLEKQSIDGLRAMLSFIGEDADRDGLADSPARFLRAMREMTSGYEDDPEKILMRQFEQMHDEMIILRNADFISI